MKKEQFGGYIFLFAGVYGFFFSVQLPLGRLNEPGPGIFPLCLSILLCISGLLWLIYGKGKGEEKVRIDWHGFIRKLAAPLKIVVATAAFIFSLNRLGYLVTSTLYMFILLLWVSRYRVWIAMGLAIILGAGSWCFFAKILEVQLPRGLWIPQ